jgi:hypothetical protein
MHTTGMVPALAAPGLVRGPMLPQFMYGPSTASGDTSGLIAGLENLASAACNMRQSILAQEAQSWQFTDDSSGVCGGTSGLLTSADPCMYADSQSTQQTPAARPAAAGKPVREKINGKDFQHFEIDPAKIESGEDTRTTVMLRNMPKSCSREDFQQLLEKCGLQDRITFLYMPFDKRRNGHCGFAFVNFTSAQDVLTMISSMPGECLRQFPAPQRCHLQ